MSTVVSDGETALLVSVLRHFEHQRRRDGFGNLPELDALRERLDKAAAARVVPRAPRSSSGGLTVEVRLTVAQAAARVGCSEEYIRRLARSDPRLRGCRDERGAWWIPQSIADEWAERRHRTVTRAAIAAADAELDALAAEYAAVDAQVSEVESQLDAARREMELVEEAAALAGDGEDVIVEAVRRTVAALEARWRPLHERRIELFARLHPADRARRTVDDLAERALIDADLLDVLEAVDKTVAVAASWDMRRRETHGRVGPSRLVADLIRLPTTMPYLNAVRRLDGVQDTRRHRAAAEQARITPPTIEEAQ